MCAAKRTDYNLCAPHPDQVAGHVQRPPPHVLLPVTNPTRVTQSWVLTPLIHFAWFWVLYKWNRTVYTFVSGCSHCTLPMFHPRWLGVAKAGSFSLLYSIPLLEVTATVLITFRVGIICIWYRIQKAWKSIHWASPLPHSPDSCYPVLPWCHHQQPLLVRPSCIPMHIWAGTSTPPTSF